MLSEKLEKLVERVQTEIEYCITCQPYDNGEAVWILGEESDLEELLDKHRIAKKYRDEFVALLRCPNCGRQLDRFDSYGAKTQYEKLVDKKHKEWGSKYHHLLAEFSSYIEKYPYLGAGHALGKKIIKLIHKFPKTKIKDQVWFRARRITDGRSFTHKDMMPPISAKVLIGEGRYNHFGQSHWYLSDSEIGAAKETLALKEKYVWMQKVYVQSAGEILDVSTGFREPSPEAPIIPTGLIFFSSTFDKKVERDKYWKPEYFVPRFVADAAKLAGFQGIKFSSTQSYANNLVLFERKQITHKLKGKPYIFELPAEKKN